MNENQTIFDTLADRFDQAWQSDETPSIGSFLSEVADSQREPLARLLLPIDIEYRRRSGEAVTSSIYQSHGETVHALAKELLAKSDSALMETQFADQSGAANSEVPVSNEADQKSRVIGPYKLLQVLGEGGMGTVWMAEQTEPVRRRVALKLIKAGADNREIIARFEAERQALAMMDHPNIAKVLDAGTAEDGSPYFVMELVQGIAINEYCDRNRLTTKERLAALVPVCRAVQHAHQKGIIHRDLKPSNVLVAVHDGKPLAKVIDFGLAKALQHQTRLTDKTMFTQFGQVVGTPQYMSPEQATLDEVNVDTRSDVYSLGVILYELLAGSTPIQTDAMREHALLKVLELIRDQEPPRPSDRVSSSGEQQKTIGEHRQVQPVKLCQILSGDLDWIVMKALDKDRSRRYESPGSFADDIERYMDGDAIHARPPSQLYKFQKFVGKHKGLVAAASTILLLLIAGIAGTSIGMIRADEARQVATANEELAVRNAAEALAEKQRADTEREKSVLAAERAMAAEKEAQVRREEAEASLAQSRLFLAEARWDQQRPADARQLLNEIPRQHRNIEWYISQRQFLGSDRTGYGHSDQVTDVDYSPDGKRIVSTSFDGTTIVWDAATAKPIHILTVPEDSYPNPCRAVAFSKDSTLVASGNIRGGVQIWNAESGKRLTEQKVHSQSISSIAFKPDGQAVASAGETVKVWDIESGEVLREISPDEEGTIQQVAVSLKGDFLATRTSDTIRIWNLESVEELYEIKARGNCVSFSADSKRLLYDDSEKSMSWDVDSGESQQVMPGTAGMSFDVVAYSSDGRLAASCHLLSNSVISIWDISKNQEVRTLVGHTAEVEDIAFSPDNTTLVSAARDGVIKTWGLSRLSRSSFVADMTATAVVVAPDGKSLATHGMGSNTVQLWDSVSGEKLKHLRGKPAEAGSRIAFSSDSSTVAIASREKTIERWNTTTCEALPAIATGDAATFCVSFSPNGQYIASGDAAGVAHIWDAESGKELHTLKGHATRVTSTVFSPDGLRLVTGGLGPAIKFWNVETGEEIASVTGPTGAGHRIVFSPDARHIATGNWGRTIEIRDAETGAKLKTLRGHAQPIFSLAYSPDGSRLVSGDMIKTMKVWDTESGREVKSMNDHTAQVDGISFSNDGNLLATSSVGLIRVYRSTTTNTIFGGHRGLVKEATFSPDDQYVATMDEEVIRVFDVANPGECHTLKGNGSGVISLDFSKDGQYILSSDRNGSLLMWETSTGRLLAEPKHAPKARSRRLSNDKRWGLSIAGGDVQVIDLAE